MLEGGARGSLEAVPARVRPDEDDPRAGRERCSGVGPVGRVPGLERLRGTLEVRSRSGGRSLLINGVDPTYANISTFKYPGARPLYIYIKNAHAGAIPAVRAYAAEFTKESAFGPNGYLSKAGLIASPTPVRAKSQQVARKLQPLNFAALK